ncbi:hypothetical protein DBW_3545 [Desulfuromonas sp. DDH964]|nr:DUF481 domain-containing protein [Desulfuromonas sp. DDH964]AMV73843.1 hypothetical protein DBW_3545 [Desulfuromonas sp. DDH964]
MNQLPRFLCSLLFVCLAAPVWAGDAPGTWKDQAELAYVDTSGNTEVTTLSAKNRVSYQFTDQIAGLWRVEILNGKSDGERNAESYFTELRGDYAYTERLYYYANASWLKDSFADIDSRTVVGAGCGYKFLTGAKHFLVGESGLTYTTEKFTNSSDDQYVGGAPVRSVRIPFQRPHQVHSIRRGPSRPGTDEQLPAQLRNGLHRRAQQRVFHQNQLCHQVRQ